MKERGQDIVKRLEDECLDSNNDDLVGFVNGVFRHVRAYHSRKAQLETLASSYPADIADPKAREDYTKERGHSEHLSLSYHVFKLISFHRFSSS